jgi:hypothetical protein
MPIHRRCPNQEGTMSTGLHAVSWSLQRLIIALMGAAFAVILAYATFIFVLVVIQAVASFGQ